MLKPLLVMAGGCIGAVSRYGVSLLAAKLFGESFPWGTFIVNMTGCLLIGLTFGLADRAAWLTNEVRIFFVTGFLGALTTFSSLANETVRLNGAGHMVLAIMDIAANVVLGLALVLAGMRLARVM